MKKEWPKQQPLDADEMSVEQLIALLQKLPPGTRMEVRAGAYQDDAYIPTVRVWIYQGRQISATLEMDQAKATGPNRHHYNYPEGYSGVEEITEKIFGKNSTSA